MRKINPHDFKVARRGTSREINRQIALNLVRAHQPISRADLARLMNVRRGVASLLVSELLSESLIFEGAVGESVGRGRRPTSLYIDSRQRCVVGVDIRASRTYILVTDLMGQQDRRRQQFSNQSQRRRFDPGACTSHRADTLQTTKRSALAKVLVSRYPAWSSR